MYISPYTCINHDLCKEVPFRRTDNKDFTKGLVPILLIINRYMQCDSEFQRKCIEQRDGTLKEKAEVR